ncbi:MAG: hypothetical protein AAFV77_04350 [Planctomycetota bacterium]
MKPIAAALFAFPALALAQGAVIIEVDDDTLLPGQSTTVTLSAQWTDYAMCCVFTDLVASTGDAGWSDLALIAPMDGPGTSEGVLAPIGVDDIIAGQLNFPPGSFPPPPNPLPFWRATYTAPDDVIAPFDVDLTTETSLFEVYVERGTQETRDLLPGLVEGSATIRVIPAPASVTVLALGLITNRRRR